MKVDRTKKYLAYSMHVLYVLVYVRVAYLLIFADPASRARLVNDPVLILLVFLLVVANLFRWRAVLQADISVREFHSMIELRKAFRLLCEELHGSFRYLISFGPGYVYLTKIATALIEQNASIILAGRWALLGIMFRYQGYIWLSLAGLLLAPAFIFVASSESGSRSMINVLLNTHWSLTALVVMQAVGLFISSVSTLYYFCHLRIKGDG